MNEKITKNIVYLSIISMLFILVFVLGKNIYDGRGDLAESENTIQRIIGKLQSVEVGLEYVNAESERRIEIIDNLRTENIRFGETEKRITEEYKQTLTDLRNANRELDRIGKESSRGIEIIKKASDRIGAGLKKFKGTIQEIEATVMD